jgi:hypothetical protein
MGPVKPANKVTKTYRANIPYERRPTTGNSRSERIEEASACASIHASDAEGSGDWSSLGLYDGSRRSSIDGASPYD